MSNFACLLDNGTVAAVVHIPSPFRPPVWGVALVAFGGSLHLALHSDPSAAELELAERCTGRSVVWFGDCPVPPPSIDAVMRHTLIEQNPPSLRAWANDLRHGVGGASADAA